jgi:hypothetical protein
LLCAALLSLGGCKSDKKDTQPGQAAADPAGQPETATPDDEQATSDVSDEAVDELDVKTAVDPDTKVPDDQLPTPADFEDEAAEKITAANMEIELETLEFELAE